MKITRTARAGIVTAALVGALGVGGAGTANAASISGLPTSTTGNGHGGLGGLQPPPPPPLTPLDHCEFSLEADDPVVTLQPGQTGFVQTPSGDNYYADCPDGGEPTVHPAPETGPAHSGPAGNAEI